MADGDLVALDLETTTLEPEKGAILAVGAATASRTIGGAVGAPSDLDALEAVLRSPRPLVVHNVRMEGSWAEHWFGIRLTGDRVLDTQLLANRAYPGQPANLAALVARDLPEVSGYKGETEELIKAGRILDVPQDDLLRRTAVDAWATLRLAPKLLSKLAPEAKPYLAEDVDLALCVKRMAERGMPFDQDRAFAIKAGSEAVQERVRQELGINPGSSQQVGGVLKSLGVELPVSDAGNPETGEIVLRAVAHYNQDERVKAVCKSVLDYREAQKLVGTYVEGYAKRRSPDGRLRSDLWWPGTISWRLSSSDPNLQNVPRGAFRAVFRPGEGWVLIEADYAQAELRIATALAREKALWDVFLRGEDPHSILATKLFGPGFTKDQRVRAKTTNFGLLYGAGPKTLWEQFAKSDLFLDLSEVRGYHRTFWSLYQGFSEYTKEQARRLRQDGYLLSPTAGYRWGWEDMLALHPEDEHEAVLSAVNAVIQCVPPRWALRAAFKAEKEGIKVILNTHDGLLIEAPASDAPRQARRIKELMEAESREDFMGGLPVPADVKVGADWASMTGC